MRSTGGRRAATSWIRSIRASIHPGDMTLADLASYKAKVREPVCGNYRSYRVCGMPLPSSGGMTVLQILGLLEAFRREIA